MATVKAQNTRFFNPTAIAGCQVWFDGADPLATGVPPANSATISTWSDKSGNGYNATPSSGRVAATFSSALNCVYFQSSNVGYQTSYPANPTNETMFIVANINSPANINNNTIIGGQLGARSFGVGYAGGAGGTGYSSYLNNEVGWQNSGVTGPSAGVTALLTGTVTTTTNVAVALNGSTFTTGTVPSWSSGTTTYLGVDTTNSSYYFIGYVMEILFYNSVLNSTQQKQIEGYLAYKWGIQGSLPATHTFYRNPYFAEAIYYPQAIIKTTGTNLKHPVAIAGLSLWFDALDVYGTGQSVPIGSVVTQWIDKSPFSNSTSSYSGSPIYSGAAINANPAIYFKSSNSPPPMYYLGNLSQTFSGTQMNCFAVATIGSNIGAASNSYSAWGRILGLARPGQNDFADTTTTFPFIQNNATQAIIIGRNNSYLSTPIPGYNTPFLVQSSHNGPMEYIGVNGNLTPASSNTGIGVSFNITSYGVGVNPNTGDVGSQFTGYIGEVIAFLGITLTTPQVQSVEGYLAWKWGLQGSLASGHPYQNNFTSPQYRNPIVRNNYTTRLNPTSIGGCRLWLDAIDPAGNGSTPANGSILSSWIDKSGSSLTVTGSSLQPTFFTTAFNGKPTVSFTAVQGSSYQTLTNSSTSLFNSVSTMTIFMMMYIPGTTPNFPSPIALVNKVVIYMKGGSAGGISAGNLYPWTYNGSSTVANLNNNVSANNYYLCCFQFDTNQYFFMNGDLGTGGPVSFSFGSGTNLPLYIGYSSYNTNDGFNGYLSEILVYTSTVTTTQRRLIEGYLAWKWGLPKSLPTTHPYYNFPPSP